MFRHYWIVTKLLLSVLATIIAYPVSVLRCIRAQMRSWLGRISSSRTLFLFALVWATVIVLVVHLLDFPGSVPNFREMSGGGILLDASPASTPDEIYQRFAEYGEQGRQNYSFRNLSVDIVLPLSVFPFLFLLALRASTTLARRGLFFGFLLALPVVYVMFDLMENATILRLLADYPTRMNGLATSLPYSTTIKRAASLLAIGFPLGLLGARFVRIRLASRAASI